MIPKTSVIIVDDKNERVIGSVPKNEIFNLKVNYRTAHVFLFDRHYESLLMQKLPVHHPRNPGKWGSSVATYCYGNNGAYEEYHQAAVRGLQEELGIKVIPNMKGLDPIPIPETNGGIKFTKLFLARYDGAIKPDYSQMDDFVFRRLEQVRSSILQDKTQFTGTFLDCFNLFEKVAERT